jgi:prepilin-type N-terminal cleavage/methylation domain-containing protein
MNLRIPNSEFRMSRMGSGAALTVKPIRNSQFAIRNCRAFTLIELMMVVAIIGLIMAAGVPAILSVTRQAPMRKAVNDVMEICACARAQAILQGQMMTVVFHPRLRQVALNGGAAVAAPAGPVTRAGATAVNATVFDHSVVIEGLGINDLDYTDSDEARVRFFPNGTSDEMILVLSCNGEYRKISLEVTTALASVGRVR